MLFKKRWPNVILFMLLAIEIWCFSSISSSGIGDAGKTYTSIAYHFIVFFLFSFFLISSINLKKKLSTNTLILTIIISIIYAIIDEIHQIFVPGRVSTITDILTDSAGSFFGILIYIIMKKNST